MACRKTIGPQILGQLEQIGKLYAHIATDTGNGRSPVHIVIGKLIDHRFSKPAFMIEHIMRNAQLIADGARIANIAARTTASGPADGFPMVIKLQRDADCFSTCLRGKTGHDRRIHPARHRNNDAAGLGRAIKLKQIDHKTRP